MAMMRARGQPGRGQRSHRRSAWVSAPQVPEYASRASIGMSNALCKPGPCRCTGQRRRGRTARSLDPRLHSTVSVRTKKVPFNTHGALLQTCKKTRMVI